MATQDAGLRKSVQAVPAGASIFLSGNGVHLEQPSQGQRDTVDEVLASPCWLLVVALNAAS